MNSQKTQAKIDNKFNDKGVDKQCTKNINLCKIACIQPFVPVKIGRLISKKDVYFYFPIW